MSGITPNELSELIKRRRSIFPPMFNDTPIAKEVILQILENANWAPNHKKTEPWRFKIFQGDSRNKLSNYLGEYYKSNTSDYSFSEMKYKKTVGKPLKSACVIAICMYNDPSVKIPEWEEIAAVACAVQNMWLTCTSMDIGAYWSSPKSIIEAREFLNLSENEKCLGLFYMGYTSDVKLKSTRHDVKEKIEWM